MMVVNRSMVKPRKTCYRVGVFPTQPLLREPVPISHFVAREAERKRGRAA